MYRKCGYRRGVLSPHLCGMLNSGGGTFYLGVTDLGQVEGLHMTPYQQVTEEKWSFVSGKAQVGDDGDVVVLGPLPVGPSRPLLELQPAGAAEHVPGEVRPGGGLARGGDGSGDSDWSTTAVPN